MTKTPSRKGYSRTERVSDVVHRILAKLICEDFKDPRIGMVTVSKVEVTPNLESAKVYISVFESDKEKETVNVLNEASGFFRSHLSKGLQIRVIPKPRFVLDKSIQGSDRIHALLESLKAESDKKK